MSFDVAPEEYARFMGRFSEPLADGFVELADPRPGQRALDVGCGPGVLTSRLVARLGADSVAAVDPSPPFVEATRARCPGADVRRGTAEALPWEDASFDHALAQLVVHFMADPVVGLGEMARVTRPGGRQAFSVTHPTRWMFPADPGEGGLTSSQSYWDRNPYVEVDAGGGGPLAIFWEAVRHLDPGAPDESGLAGTHEGQLVELLRAAGLREVDAGSLGVRVLFAGFEQWWEPYTLGVGPAGADLARLDDDHRTALEERCRAMLPQGPFEVSASAWTAVGVV